MSKSPDEGEKDRLTSEEFVDLIPHLPFGNILEIEFFINDWKHLITTTDNAKRLYRCNLCTVTLSGHKSVSSHINGKKHLGNMTQIKYLYHPEYTFTKAQLKATCETSNKKNKDQNKDAENNAVSPKNTAVLQKKPVTNVEATNTNDVENRSTEAEESNEKTEQTQSKKSVEKSNEKAITKNEKFTSNNKSANQNDLGNKESVNKKAQQNFDKNSDQNKDSQKSHIPLQQKPENNNKNDTKLAQKTVKPPNQNGKKGSNTDGSNTSYTETKDKSIDKPGNNGKPDNDKSKPIVRLVPIDKLQMKSEKIQNQNLKIAVEKGVGSEKNQNESNPKNTEFLKSGSSKKVGAENLNATIQKPETKESKESDQTIKPLPNQIPSNIETKKTQVQVKEKDLPSNQKKQLNENIKIQTSNNEKSDSKLNSKLVRNPLAGKKNNLMASSEKSQNEAPKNTTSPEVIVIDDNDDNDDNRSKNNPNKIFNKDSDPPAKKQKMSSSPTTKIIENPEPNKKGVVNRSNIVAVATGAKSGQVKSTEKSANEPAFAVKSVTDSLAKADICGFVGVEYVIKICRNAAPPKYECGLCELVLDGQCMQNHLLGYTHRLKFCEKHFPTAIQQFRQYILNVSPDEHYKVMIPVLQKLTVAIEEHHGRSLPFDCEERRYNLERHRVLTEVFARRHASEQRGPTFTHVVDSKQVDEFILRKDAVKLQPTLNKIAFDRQETKIVPNKQPSQEIKRHSYEAPRRFNHNVMPHNMGMQPNAVHPFNSQSTFLDDETHKRMVEKFLNANKSNVSQQKSARSNHNERELRKIQSSKKRSHSPSRRDFGSKNDSHTFLNIWSSYCRLVDNKLQTLRESFQKYRSNPESHPSYKAEWLKFWHRRKTEVMAMGKDYRTYDFQPDWVPFFNNRINELYDEAFEKLKVEAREELSLPMINDHLCDPKYFVHVSSDNYSPAIKKLAPPPSINTTAMSSQMNMGVTHSQNLNKGREVAPPTKGRLTSTAIESSIKTNTKEIEIQDEPAPTVVSVLRLLTALEEYLGSLGPKIVELLSKALQAEKSNQGRSQVLLTEDNCTILETAMEKFKGLVIAGILDPPKERALKKAISKVNALLDYTKEIKAKHPSFKQSEFLSNASKPHVADTDSRTNNQRPIQNVNDKLKQALQSVSNANDISKVIHLIEEKIAAALKAQGRTDVDRAHLEQLAAVCVLLEKKKREAGNLESHDLPTQSSTLQQPLSDTLKKIVGTISGNSLNKEGNKQNDTVQPTADLNNKGRFPVISGVRHIDTISSHSARGLNPTSNVGELKNLINNGNPQGNFSNLYSRNNQVWMGGDSSFGANPQPRPWQVQQPQQHNATSVFNWAQNPNRSWSSNEGPSSSGQSSQRAAYQSNFGPAKPSAHGQFRYN